MTRSALSCCRVWVSADAQNLTDSEIVLGDPEGAPKPRVAIESKVDLD